MQALRVLRGLKSEGGDLKRSLERPKIKKKKNRFSIKIRQKYNILNKKFDNYSYFKRNLIPTV